MNWRAWRAARAEHRLDTIEVNQLVAAWDRVCEVTGVSHRVDTALGPTIVTPKVVFVTLGSPLELLVKLLPGQLPRDIEAAGSRIAPALGGRSLRVERRGNHHVRVEVVVDDPLGKEIPLVQRSPEVHIGRTERGVELFERWERMPHAIVQGVTRSGKSVWLYAQLAQVAPNPDILVAGSDPSGLLWRPWERRPHHNWRVSGLSSIEAHEALFAQLVVDMDRRIKDIPRGADTVVIDSSNPLILVVLEEYPGLLRAADQYDKKIGQRIRAHISRLLAESHKAGFRVIMVAQRAESNVVGGFERAMCGFRLSFRVDNSDSIKLLHPTVAVDRIDGHMTAAPGIALLTAPGINLTRIRGPWCGGYSAYCASVEQAN